MAAALVGLVMASLFTFFVFGMKAFYRSASRADLQQNARIAADFITGELRYAGNLELVGEDKISYTCYSSGKIRTIKKKQNEVVILTGSAENKIAYNIEELSFSSSSKSGSVISFAVRAADSDNTVLIRSAVRVKNE